VILNCERLGSHFLYTHLKQFFVIDYKLLESFHALIRPTVGNFILLILNLAIRSFLELDNVPFVKLIIIS